MYGYSLYLFFDFAGYSAFAIGVSYLLGVHAPENFHRPFLAAQHPGLLEPLAHQPLVLVPRSCLHAIPAAGDEAALVHEPLHGLLRRPVLSFGLMGVWHGPQRTLRPLWAIPRCAAHRTRCLQTRGAPDDRPRTLLAR